MSIYPVECPTCGAHPAARCRALTSGRTTDYHAARREAFWDRRRNATPTLGHLAGTNRTEETDRG